MLKDKQKEAIHNFVRGHDCFVILPTGYGIFLAVIRVRPSSKENNSVF